MLEHAVQGRLFTTVQCKSDVSSQVLGAMWEHFYSSYCDVSTGNILYDGENSRLSDLDYATLHGDNAPSISIQSVQTVSPVV